MYILYKNNKILKNRYLIDKPILEINYDNKIVF